MIKTNNHNDKVMNNNAKKNINDQTINNNIKINSNAIISVIKISLNSMKNSIKLDSPNSSIIANISNLIRKSSSQSDENAIQIKINNNKLFIKLFIAIQYGINIATLTQKIQHIIIKKIKTILNYDVADISIVVQNII